jgi:hypothetical protein
MKAQPRQRSGKKSGGLGGKRRSPGPKAHNSIAIGRSGKVPATKATCIGYMAINYVCSIFQANVLQSLNYSRAAKAAWQLIKQFCLL